MTLGLIRSRGYPGRCSLHHGDYIAIPIVRIAVASIRQSNQSAKKEIGLPECPAGFFCPDAHVEPHSYIAEPRAKDVISTGEPRVRLPMATKTQEHSNAAAYQRSLKELPEPNHTIDREKYDVVIIGAGPAGLFSGAALARFGWDVLVVDNRSEPTIAGRAGSPQVAFVVNCRWCAASND